MRRFLLVTMTAALIALATMVGAQPAIAQESAAEDVIIGIYDAYNAGDVDALLDYYAEDAYIDFTYGDIYTGHDEIEEWLLDEMDAGGYIEYEILDSDDSTVEAFTSYTNDLLSYALDATEVFVLEDGLVLAHSWLPTDETVALLLDDVESDDLTSLYGQYGIIGNGSFFIPDNAGDDVELKANFIGIIEADGSGTVEGIRVLNGTSVYQDEIYGVYSDAGDGSLSFQWEAYQSGDDELNGQEVWDCFIQTDGDEFQCIITAYLASTGGDDLLPLRVVATIDGQRID